LRVLIWISLVPAVACLSGCGPWTFWDPRPKSEHDPGVSSAQPLTLRVTFDRVKTQVLVPLRCVECHSYYEQAADARPYGNEGYQRAAAETMPPSGGVTQAQIGLFKAWVDQGMP
jgi:hypothetical protein